MMTNIERYARFFTGWCLICIAALIPIVVADLAASKGIGFSSGLFLIYASLFFSAFLLFLTAILFGSAYPGIASIVNRRWQELTSPLLRAVVTVLYAVGFAGQNSRWQLMNVEKVNFWVGFLHGFVILPASIMSLVTDEITVRETNNNGLGYFVGFIFSFTFVIYLLFN